MSLSVTCYIQREKPKSRRVLEAFAAGCGARIAYTTARTLEPGAAVFYGVRAAWAHLWRQAKDEGRDWFYVDNAWFDASRERAFRVAKNRIQHDGRGESDGKRFAALGLTVKPWRGGGDYALVCAQSDEFMATVAGDPTWLKRTTAELRMPFVVRHKGTKRPFAEDLARARCVVTWSSAAAVGAILEGVPVVCSEHSAAHGVTDRLKWARALADNEWSLDELARGDAWTALNG